MDTFKKPFISTLTNRDDVYWAKRFKKHWIGKILVFSKASEIKKFLFAVSQYIHHLISHEKHVRVFQIQINVIEIYMDIQRLILSAFTTQDDVYWAKRFK